MSENAYSEEEKLILFVDWLGCNKDSLNILWFDSDFITGFKAKCLSEAATELRNRSYYEGLQKNLKEIEGFIYEYLYLDVFVSMKDRHTKENYEFDNVRAVYAVIHQWIGFNKFRDFFKRNYLGLDTDIKTQDLEEVEVYRDDSTSLEIDKVILEKDASEKSGEIQKSLQKILEEFKSFLEKKKRKNSNDYTLFLREIYNAIRIVGLKNEDQENEKKTETIDINIDNIIDLAVLGFLAPPVTLHQDKIKQYIETQTSYLGGYGESLKKIRNYWKEFIYDNADIEQQVNLYQQRLQDFTEVKIHHHFKASDNQKDY